MLQGHMSIEAHGLGCRKINTSHVGVYRIVDSFEKI